MNRKNKPQRREHTAPAENKEDCWCWRVAEHSAAFAYATAGLPEVINSPTARRAGSVLVTLDDCWRVSGIDNDGGAPPHILTCNKSYHAVALSLNHLK